MSAPFIAWTDFAGFGDRGLAAFACLLLGIRRRRGNLPHDEVPNGSHSRCEWLDEGRP